MGLCFWKGTKVRESYYLSEIESERFRNFREKIRNKRGHLEIVFKPSSGIGIGIEVRRVTLKGKIREREDITDYSTW